MDAQGVQVLAAPDLELGHVSGLLDLDGARVLPAGGQQEVLDLVNLLWLRCSKGKKRERSESGRLNEAKVSRGESAARRTASWGSGEALGHLRESGATRPLTREGPEGTPPLQPRRGWNDPTDGRERGRNPRRITPLRAPPATSTALHSPPSPRAHARALHTHTLSLSHVPSWLSSSSLLLRVLVSLAGLALPPTKAAAAEAPPGFSQVAVDFPC